MRLLSRLTGSTFVRTIAGYVVVAVILGGAWLYSLSGPLTNAVVAQQERNLTAVAQSAALLVAESHQAPQRLAKELVARTDLRLTIVASDGRVVADSHFLPGKMGNHADRPEIRSALGGVVGRDKRLSATEGYEQVYVAVPGSLDGKRVAVRVSQSLEDVRLVAENLRRFGLMLLVFGLVVAIPLAAVIARAASRPVRELSDVSQRMAGGNLSVRIPEVPADLEPLATALSALRDQIRERIEALDTERQTLRAALDGLADAVLVVEDGQLVTANRAAASIASSSDPLREGASIEQLPFPASLKAAIRDQLAAPDPDGRELEPEPTGRTWHLAVAPMLSPNATTRSIVVIADITERSRLERVRREFVANASHELKTPVAGIRLLAESAASAAADGDDEHAAEFSRQITGEVGRLQRLVGDLLDLSRLEALPAPDEVTDMRAAIDIAMVGHRSAADQRGLSLSLDLSAVRDVDVFAAADPTDVAVALDNLVDNALRYTEAGSVTVTLEAPDTGHDVVVRVADTGPGIATEHLPRIFERFYRVDKGRSRDAGGTGLGLALVRHVAERNGGSVSVESHVGIGTTFTLTLPRFGGNRLPANV